MLIAIIKFVHVRVARYQAPPNLPDKEIGYQCMEAGYPETQNKKDSIARTFVVLLDGLQMTITDTLKKKK